MTDDPSHLFLEYSVNLMFFLVIYAVVFYGKKSMLPITVQFSI